MNALKFAQLLCSKLCHDLITPIGAISSGFEILQECEGPDRQSLLDLTMQSAETAARRLTFYRIAFGYSGAETPSKFMSIQKLIQDFLQPLKIHLAWESCESCSQNPHLLMQINLWSKLLMNLVLVGAEGMPYGGQIRITNYFQDNLIKFSIHFEGKLMAIRPQVLLALQNNLDIKEHTPYTIQTALLMSLVDELQAKLEILPTFDTEFCLQVTK